MEYDHKTLLSLKLRSSTYLRKLSRGEMLTRMQITRALEPITNAAWKRVEEKRWREQLDDDPHGHPWHVSFHASQFPGDGIGCPRQALYRMADFPRPEPTSRWLRATAEAGKAIEVTLVNIYHEDGLLLSAPPSEKIQTGFEITDAWLTGSVDCVIRWPGTNRPTPIEVKTKYQRVIDAMKIGKQGPDGNHVFQIKVQLALARHAQVTGQLWGDMDPITHGYIYYLSRDEPSDTAEFRVDLDEKFFEAGIAQLKEWQKFWEAEELPEFKPGKRTSKFGHPHGWRWSYAPCQFCSFKKTCQLDFREGITSLPESVGVARAKLAREDYDYEAARERVAKRWTPDK